MKTIAEPYKEPRINGIKIAQEPRRQMHVSSSIPELTVERISDGLSCLSLTQLEGMLVAATLLVDTWRMTTPARFKCSSVRRSPSGGSPLCP